MTYFTALNANKRVVPFNFSNKSMFSDRRVVFYPLFDVKSFYIFRANMIKRLFERYSRSCSSPKRYVVKLVLEEEYIERA